MEHPYMLLVEGRPLALCADFGEAKTEYMEAVRKQPNVCASLRKMQFKKVEGVIYCIPQVLICNVAISKKTKRKK